jgi:hypothetical protein
MSQEEFTWLAIRPARPPGLHLRGGCSEHRQRADFTLGTSCIFDELVGKL